MSRANLSVVGWVVLASLMLVLGLTAWLAGASPFRTAQAAGLIDDSFADFSGGTGCYVRASGVGGLDGEVIIAPTIDTDFGGSPLTVDEGTTAVSGALTPGQTLEFTATFVAISGQLGGLGVANYSVAPFAIFNSNGIDLLVRTDAGTGETASNLGNTYFGSPHRYRIDWGPTSVVYSIDGGAVTTHSVAIAADMQVLYQDFNLLATSLVIDRVRVQPWTCVFVSRAIDSTYSGFTFTGISTTLTTPTGTGITFEARTSSDGATWGAWVPVNGNGTFNAGVNQYLQYQATLSTTDPQAAPEVWLVQAHGTTPSAVRLDSFSARPMDDAGQSWLIALSGFVLILGAGWLIGQRRRRFD